MTSTMKFKNALDLTSFNDFLTFIKVLKMLYGRDVAEKVFTKALKECYNVDSASIINLKKD